MPLQKDRLIGTVAHLLRQPLQIDLSHFIWVHKCFVEHRQIVGHLVIIGFSPSMGGSPPTAKCKQQWARGNLYTDNE